MVGESNKSVYMIQIDASSFAEFEISDFEIARVDCTKILRKIFISQKQFIQKDLVKNTVNPCSVRTYPVFTA